MDVGEATAALHINPLPGDWQVTLLKDLTAARLRNGYSPVCPSEPTGRWVLSLGALGPSGLDPTEKKPAPANDSKVAAYILRPGDFLISRSNTLHRVGLSALFRGEINECAFPDLMMQFRVREREVVPEFLESYLRSPAALQYFRRNAAGTSGSMVKLDQTSVGGLPVILPPLPEQQKIAAILSSVDDAIAATRKVIEQTKRVKQGLLQTLMTRGIGHTRFKKTEIGEIPEGWEVVPLGILVTLRNGRGFKSTEWAESGLPIIKIGNLNGSEDYDFFSGELDDRHRVRRGDLLFSWSGSRGSSFGPYIWRGPEGALNQHIFRVDVMSRATTQGFLYQQLRLLTSKIEQSAHGGAGLVHVRKTDLVKYNLALPPLEEQVRIVDILDKCDRFAGRNRKSLRTLLSLKRGLLQDLLTGRVRVTPD